jgi:hypothetical protein
MAPYEGAAIDQLSSGSPPLWHVDGTCRWICSWTEDYAYVWAVIPTTTVDFEFKPLFLIF